MSATISVSGLLSFGTQFCFDTELLHKVAISGKDTEMDDILLHRKASGTL
jgi:hypothetical protein